MTDTRTVSTAAAAVAAAAAAAYLVWRRSTRLLTLDETGEALSRYYNKRLAKLSSTSELVARQARNGSQQAKQGFLNKRARRAKLGRWTRLLVA